MAWFKVDDHFHTSRKVKSIPPRQRFAAVGLWAIAGSWCSQELTDGHVPDYMIQEWGATAKVTAALVDSGLWRRVRDGFEFCSWSEYNPTKSRVEAERAASKARMEASRRRKREKAAGSNSETSDVALQRDRISQTVLRRPDPTRPDPTHSSSGYVEREGHVTQCARNEPPSKNCSKHPHGTDRPCGQCGDARRAFEVWESDQREHEKRRKSDEARQRAEVARLEIDACGMCDHNGYRGHKVCNHDPGEDDRRRRGVALVREALAKGETA